MSVLQFGMWDEKNELKKYRINIFIMQFFLQLFLPDFKDLSNEPCVVVYLFFHFLKVS